MRKFLSLLMVMFSVLAFAATETTVYYTAPASTIGDYTVKLNVNFRGDGDAWQQYDMTLTELSYNGDPVYTQTFTDLYNGVGVMQFQLFNGDVWQSQKDAITTWTSVTEYNGKMYVHATEQWVAAPGEGGGEEPAVVPTGKDSVFFVNVQEWATPRIHLWGGTAAGTEWPGVAMVKLADKINNYDVYKYVADAGAYANCIFNNNGASQTSNLVWNSGKYFYENAWYALEEIPTQGEEPAEVDSVTVYFVNVPGWNPVKAFVWESNTQLYNQWPGDNMTKLANQINEKDVYSFTFPASYSSIIFDNGNSGEGNQTADLTVNAAKPYYYDGAWYTLEEIPAQGGEPAVDPKTGYALLVVGGDTIDLVHGEEFEGYDQWYTEAAELHAGDVVKVYNYDTQAAWAIGILNPASSSYVSNSENGLVFSKDSIYTIYVKFKYELDEIYVAPFDNEGGDVPPVDPTDNLPIVSLAGTMNGWNASANLFVPAQDSLSASLKIELEAGLDSFKIVSDNRWLSLWGEPGTLYKVHRGWPRADHVNVVDGANFLFEADVTGEYTFTWTYADSTLVVTFPEKGDDPVIDPKTGYALLVVGGDTIDLVHGEEFEGYDQWYTEAAELHAGDVVKVYNYDTQAAWAIGILNPASSSYVSNSENGLVFSKDSIYTIYVKFKYELDEIYVAPFDNEGGDVPPEPCNGKYGIMLGETFVPAKLNEAQEAWTEYYIDSLELAAGATFTLYDSCALAAWIVTPAYMDEAYAFDTVGAKYTVTMDGIYNLYIKLIPGADELFVNNLSYVAPEPPTPCSGKYGILLGETFVPATRNEAQTEWLEYAIDSIVLAEGATFQLYDSCNGAAWIVNAAFGDEAYAFDTLNNKYVVTMAGAYNLYIKLIPEHDELYVFNRDYVAPEPPTPCSGKYGILLGETFVPATRNEAQTEWLEYAIDSIVLAEGATFQLYDSCNGAAWIVNAAFGDEAYAFDTLNNKYVVTMAGAYNLYIKLIPEHDELYVFNRDYVAPEPEKHYMVYGEAAVANGEDWNENSDINVMTTTDGGLTYTLTIEGLTLQALPRVYEFKIIEKGNNGIEYFPRRYGANASFHVEEAGIYTITYIYTVATENCVMNLQKTGDFEPTLANGYYLVGDFAGVASWNPVAERMFAVNPDNEAEMVLAGVTLAADDSLKVVYVENDNIVTWYPENADNYVVDADHAGLKDIYFRADYQGAEDWYAGCIYISANEGMAIINAEIEKVAVKQLRNGMVIIRRGDREYTIMGQLVK